MTTQYTPILKLALPVTGELSGLWGDVVNENITSMVEQAIAGLATINSWTTNSHTLTTADGTTSESRCAMLVADDDGAGNPSAAATIICPNATKLYVLKNISGQTVTLKTAAGSGVAVPNNQTAFLFCDGTNVNSALTTLVTGGTVNGDLSITGNVTLGDSSSDTVAINGKVTTDIIPSTDNTKDLGTVANSWRTLYLDTSALIANISIVGNTISSTDTNGNITLQPNGTGDVVLSADTVQVGDAGATATITTNGAGNLVLNTNGGTNSGSITIANGANANITIQPNGTGDIYASADTLYVGDTGTAATIASNGGENLNLNAGLNSIRFESPVVFTNTAASATGSLKFNTDAFVIDSTNKRIGVGVATPLYSAHFSGSIFSSAYAASRIPFISGATAGLIVDSDKLKFESDQLNVNGITFGKGTNSLSECIAIGYNPLQASAGSGSIAIGKNSIGTVGNSTSDVAIGNYSIYYGSTISQNTAIGDFSMTYCGSVYRNVAIGALAMRGTGSFYNASENTSVGYQSLINISNGATNNVCIGSTSGADAVANITTQSNYVVLGNNSTTNANIKVAWTVTSDARDKTDFGLVPYGLDFVSKLKPTAYKYRKDRTSNEAAEGARTRYGFLAQDILPLEIHGGVIIDETDPENLKFNEASLIPVLVNAIKELKAEVDALKTKLAGA